LKIVILSLRVVNDRSVLNYDLTGKLTNFWNHHSPTFEIKLPTGTVYLNKYTYLNRFKIFQSEDPNIFFMVFGYKKPHKETVLKLLLRYQANQKIPLIKPRVKHKKVA
jgi:hypothetical protein